MGSPASDCVRHLHRSKIQSGQLVDKTAMNIGSVLADPVTWIILTGTALYLLYRRGTTNFTVFSDQGIPGPKPVPFLGNAWGMWKQNFQTSGREQVKKYGKVFGSFLSTAPSLNTIDTELIKSVFVKDFDHFINRRDMDFSSIEVFRYFLTTMEDQPWKDVRSAITPTFTTGKIKRYAVQMKEVTEKYFEHFRSIVENQGKMELKDEISVLTMAIIAKCAFGMTIQDLGGKDDPFIKNAKKLVDPPEMKSPAVLLLFILPSRLMKWLGKSFFPMESWRFFFDIVKTMFKERANSTQKFHDFPEMTAQAIASYTKEENGKKVPMWTEEQVSEIVTAQSALFLVGGYTTTSNAITTACFMLARHPEVQEKLYNLIIEKMDKYDEICHDMIQEIPYLEYVMNESMRMHPAAPAIERRCNKEIQYDGVRITKDMMVAVPVYALHYSEEYYTDPETFNPERWTPENKANLDPYAFMPFGLGPRNCVAMRFAQEEVKLILCMLIKEFRFFPVQETPMHLTIPDGIGSVDPVNTMVGIASR